MNWEMVRLGYVFNLQMGKTPSRNRLDYWKDGDNEWISISDIGDEKYITNTKETISNKAILESGIKVVPKDTVIMSFKLSLGKTCITAKDMYTNEAIMAFINNESKEIDNNYLYYCLKNSNWTVGTNKAVKGITLNKATLTDIQIPLPPIEIQRKIAEVLDKAQELVDKRKKQIELLDQFVKSTFIEMFGDPVTNPKGWEIGKIGDLAIRTQYGTSSKASESKIGYPILRMNNITYKGNWNFADLKYVELSEKDCEKYLVHKGELLFNRTNSKKLVGKTAVYRLDKPMAFAGYLVKLIPNSRANSEFISAYLNSNHGKSVLRHMAKNIVGMANINAEELKRISIYIPPIDLQNQFANIVEQAEKQKDLLNTGLEKLERNYKSTMQNAFNGELFS